MECDRAREAISARIDGEDPGLPGGVLDAHLAGCADCRDWQQRAHAVTRRARLGGPFLDHDLTAQVLAVIPPARAGRRRRLAQRTGLTVVALAQVAVTVPLLILGHDHGADSHAAHELGSFDLALAITFAVGAIRPALSAGLAWPSGIAAASLVITAITDMISGQTFGADEAQHLIAAAGAALLFWQARTGGTQQEKAALTTRRDDSGSLPAAASPPAAAWLRIQPKWPGGGSDAARTAGPAPAARTETAGLQAGQPDGTGAGGPEELPDGSQRQARDHGEAVA